MKKLAIYIPSIESGGVEKNLFYISEFFLRKKIDIYIITANKNKKSSTLRSLGAHPESQEEIVVKEGRYGPYVSDGKINASLNNSYDSESVTLEQATELINERRAKGPAKKRRKKKKK